MEWFDKNSTALIAAGAALLSALVAGGFALLGAWLNNRQNNERLVNQIQHEISKENRKLFLDKGEELYVSLHSWSKIVNAHYIAEHDYILGKIDEQQKRTLLKDYFIGDSYVRVETLICLYFPELDEFLNKARTARYSSYSVLDKFSKNPSDVQQTVRLLMDSNVRFDLGIDELQTNLQKILLEQIKK